MGGSPSPWGAAHGVSSGCVTGPRSKLPSALGASCVPAVPSRAPALPLSHTSHSKEHGQPPRSAVGPYPSDFLDTVSSDPKRPSQVRCQRQHVLSRRWRGAPPPPGRASCPWPGTRRHGAKFLPHRDLPRPRCLNLRVSEKGITPQASGVKLLGAGTPSCHLSCDRPVTGLWPFLGSASSVHGFSDPEE